MACEIQLRLKLCNVGKSLGYLAAVLIALCCSTLDVQAAEPCRAYLELLSQPGFQDEISQISKIRTFGLIRTHKVFILQNPESDQVVVILGEAHFKSKDDTELVETFVKRFKDVAVELVHTDDPKKVEFRNKFAASRSSNILRALTLDPERHRVHLIDRELPGIFDPFNMIVAGMGAATFYMGYANVAMFTSGGSAEIWVHHLISPPPLVALPITATMTAIGLYSLDGIVGTAAHLFNNFKVAENLPLTSHLLNKRNVHMTQRIADLMAEPEAQRDNLVVIVGRMHVRQMIDEMKKHGFYEVP